MPTHLITGGAGFVGVNLVRRLLAAGERIIVVDDLSRGHRSFLLPFERDPLFSFVQLDCAEAGAFASGITELQAGPISDVWHLAANSDIPGGVADPHVDLHRTFMTTFATLIVMRDMNIPVLHFASSSAVYGDLKDQAISELSGPPEPISNYGAMKLASEAQIRAAVESFLSGANIFRFPNVIGLPATHGVMLDLIRKARSTPSGFDVLGDGTQQKIYLHVDDLLDAMMRIRERAGRGYNVFNIGPADEGVTVREIAETVRDRVAPRANSVGQVAQSLLERADASKVRIHTVARPEVDLARPETVEKVLMDLRPDAVVNAAAYTAVDLAESEPSLAYQINSSGAEAAARAAAKLGIPIVQLSTDYVFDGSLDRPYREDDPTEALGVYGDSKLKGERAVAAVNGNHVIIRTAWIYSPFGKNFARTMLALASKREQISVVRDQLGAPTYALDIADGIIAVVRNLLDRPAAQELRGIFHMTGGGETNWAEFAKAIFAASAAAGGPSARVVPISTSEYPTPARRPANSRLNNSQLANVHCVRLPHWQQSLQKCIERLVAQDFK
jgi:dTDP-4-dehydrorhamnose reductase